VTAVSRGSDPPAARGARGWFAAGAVRRVYRGAAGLILVFGAAQLALWAGRVSPAVFPLPSALLSSVADLARSSDFLASVGATMAVWAEAMAITVAIAVPAGLLLGMLPWAESAMAPVIEFLRPFPAVVLIPLVLLVVQNDMRTQVVIIVYAAMWPVLINTGYGVRNVDSLAKETMRSFGFGPLAVAGRVALPSAAPFAATGVRIAASFAFVVAIAVELVGTGMSGIGAFTSQEESGTGGMTVLIAVAVWSGLIGLTVNAVFVAAERRLFRWHYALTGTQP
jgi:NitT/TauT family transport system permease protein